MSLTSRALSFSALGLALLASPALAHTGEYLRAIALHPTNPDVFAVRYEAGLGGVMFSRDGGKTVNVMPGQAFYIYPLRWRVPMLMGGDGKLELALDDELRLDDGAGCGLEVERESIASGWITDLTQHPSDPNITFITTTANPNSDSVQHAGMWKRDAQGTLSPLGASDVQGATLGQLPFRPTSLEVIARSASVDGLRFLEAGLAADPSSPAMQIPVLRISDDLGQTWSTHTIPNPTNSVGLPTILVATSGEPFKALVSFEDETTDVNDDADPDDPIYITRDGGQSFTLFLDAIQMSGSALLLPSGQVLLGGRGARGGLWSARDLDSAPNKVQDIAVHCLATQPGTQKVVMCRRHELGYYEPDTNAFCAFFQMTELKKVVSCPSAALDKNEKVTNQLCNGFCSAQHYSESPLCNSFDVGNASLCGAAAHAYDVEIGYIAPPGITAAPRCSGAPPLDAGVSAEDAGSDASLDAADAGLVQAADAGPEQALNGEDPADDDEDEPNDDSDDDDDSVDEDDAEPEDDLSTTKRKKKKGCACSLDAHESPAAEGLPLLALAVAFALRSRRRQ